MTWLPTRQVKSKTKAAPMQTHPRLFKFTSHFNHICTSTVCGAVCLSSDLQLLTADINFVNIPTAKLIQLMINGVIKKPPPLLNSAFLDS